jgi:hypothetical protein
MYPRSDFGGYKDWGYEYVFREYDVVFKDKNNQITAKDKTTIITEINGQWGFDY